MPARMRTAGLILRWSMSTACRSMSTRRQNNLSTDDALDLFVQMARAVAYAHNRLIVHQDLKPSNVLVKEGGDVRLLDFGIAHLLQAGASDGRRWFGEISRVHPSLRGARATRWSAGHGGDRYLFARHYLERVAGGATCAPRRSDGHRRQSHASAAERALSER